MKVIDVTVHAFSHIILKTIIVFARLYINIKGEDDDGNAFTN